MAAPRIRVLRVSYCLRIPSPWIGIVASYFTTWSRHGNITSYPSAVEGRGIHPVIVDASTSALDGIHGTTLSCLREDGQTRVGQEAVPTSVAALAST